MSLTTAQLAVLITELNTDPRGYGYASDIAIGSDGGVATRINRVRDGTNPPTNPTAAGGSANGAISVKRPNVTPAEVLEAIDVRDFAATQTGISNATMAASWFESVTQFAQIRLANTDGTKTTTRKNIDRMVNDTQGSQTRLDAIAVRSGSRAEELFGFGVNVTSDDVSRVLRPGG